VRAEFRAEYKKIVRNYSTMDPRRAPTCRPIESIARSSVAQRYLDRVNAILGRHEKSPRA